MTDPLDPTQDPKETISPSFGPPAPASSLPGDPLSPPTDAPADAPSIEERMQALEEERAAEKERLHQLELENARLQGRLEGGGGQPEAQRFAFDTLQEYQLAGRNFQLMAQGMDQDDPQLAQLRQNAAAMDADYNRFLAHQQSEQAAEQQRKIDRAAFYAARSISPDSDIARYVEVLHENDVPFEHIEHQILSPRAQLEEIRRKGGQGAALSAATQIEGGAQRQAAPAPLGQQQLSPDQYAANDLVRRMENRNPDVETQMFGDNEFLE